MPEIKPIKYVRKPLYVDVVQVTEENFEDVAKWCMGDIVEEGATKHIRVRVHAPKSPRQTKAYVGDWILYTDRGYKIYLDKAFKDNFDAVEEDKPATAAQP